MKHNLQDLLERVSFQSQQVAASSEELTAEQQVNDAENATAEQSAQAASQIASIIGDIQRDTKKGDSHHESRRRSGGKRFP